MFDFNSLNIVKPSSGKKEDPFVGIRRGTDGALEFRMPRGFFSFPENSFLHIKELFFNMYKTFRKFEEENLNDKYLDSKDFENKKDSFRGLSYGYSFVEAEGEIILLYSKINAFERIIELYNDLDMDFLCHKHGRSERVDYSKIDSYLDKAIYLEDDVIYLDEMDLRRNEIDQKITSIVSIFCFITSELFKELNFSVSDSVKEVAADFSYKYLKPEEGLFSENCFREVVHLLRVLLEEVDRNTVYKDFDYYQFYNAVESFLYDEVNYSVHNDEGVIWGINNFAYVWESMCNAMIFKDMAAEDAESRDVKVMCADTSSGSKGCFSSNFRLGKSSFFIYKDKNFFYPFYFQSKSKKRYIRPDIVLSEKIHPEDIFKKEISIFPLRKTLEKRDFICLLDKEERFDFGIKAKSNIFSDKAKKLIESLKGKSLPAQARFSDNKFYNYPRATLERFKRNFFRENYLVLADDRCFKIIDWKYLDFDNFVFGYDRMSADLMKQLAYEYCLVNSRNFKKDRDIVRSQFGIPWFFREEDSDYKCVDDEGGLHGEFLSSGVELFKINFSKAQEAYLKNV